MALSNSAYYYSLVIQTAMKQGLSESHAKMIAAQAAFETNEFTSNNFVKNNNAFGMAVPKKRKSPYIIGAGTVNAPAGEGGFAYASYYNVQDSVKDIIHWLNYNGIDWHSVNSPDEYDAFIKSKNYHEESQSVYTAGLWRYYNKIKDLAVKNPKTAIATIVLGITLFVSGILLYHNRKKLA